MNACEVLRGLGRGVCVHCGAVQVLTGRSCPQCHALDPPRPPRAGDRLPPPRPGRPAAGPQDFLPPGLPEDVHEAFLERVRSLPSMSVLHVPVDQREKHARILTDLLERMAEGDTAACVLEEARTKLLLGPVPRGAHVRVELAKRLERWNAGAFTELLVRAEEQQRARARCRAALRGMPKHGARARRARSLVGEGAYSKAASSLHTEMADLDEAAQLAWSATLLPCSTRPAAALAPPDGPAAPAAPEAEGRAAGYALRGVRFRAMSAPGPSGMRPEHLRELVAVRDRRTASRLLASISKFVDAAIAGELCDAARWILDSRLVYLRKKTGTAPRPIRVGELWRRVVAKRVVDASRKTVQQVCLAARQFGVAIPGGTDGLVHFRTQLEACLSASDVPMVVIDVDFKNAFPSIEWDSIRDAVEEMLPNAAPWTHWCHSAPGRVILPSGAVTRIDRGAEQGDPLGPIYCALVLAKVVERARITLLEKGIQMFDAWFLDDGQLLCAPDHADAVLRALDAEAARVGAARATGVEAKSVARLVGSPAAVAACDPRWATEYVLASTTREPGRQEHVLGVDFGIERSPSQQFLRATEAVAELHESISQLQDTASELVLLRKCADVCKVAHLLRAAGHKIAETTLQQYDAVLRRSLTRCLGGQLDDLSLEQASLGVRSGGLGMRKASDMALPAFVASRTESRWLVHLLAGTLPGALGSDLVAGFDAETAAAQVLFEARLTSASATQAHDAVEQAAAARATPDAALGLAPSRGREAALTGDGLVLPAGAEDLEWEPGSLQATLCAISDSEAVEHCLARMDVPELQDRRRRLLELRDPSVSHDWLWRLSPAHGPVVPSGEFQLGLRIRLGAPCTDPATECARCGVPLGAANSHAFCCAQREATRGHYAVRDEVLVLAHLADPSAAAETAGLIPSAPALRPADILTSAALPGRLAALDIGVTSPDAAGAGDDCCDAMQRRKRKQYQRHLHELEVVQDTAYRPMVWSAFGRAHPDAQVMLAAMAAQAARRRGLRDQRLILRRVCGAIGVALVRRSVHMVLACTPHLDAEEERALFGSWEAPHHPQLRAISLIGGEAGAAGPA